MSSQSEPIRQEPHAPHERPVARESLEQGHEASDVNYRGILLFAGSLITAAIIIHLVLYWVLLVWSREPLPLRVQVSPTDATAPSAPGPGLEAVPRVEAEMTDEQQLEILTTYGWLDREAGMVRVPITQAMEWLIETGEQAQEGEIPTFGLDPAYRLDSSGGLEPASDDEQ